jgi:hypothetical protein
MSEHDPVNPADEDGFDPFAIGDAEAAWAQANDDDFDDEPPPARGLAMRHPLLLILVLAGTTFMFIKSYPKAVMVFEGDIAACGDLTDRPILRRQAPEKLPELKHDLFCTLTGVVESRNIYATGEAAQTNDLRTRDAKRKYYLKLNGDNVFAIVSGGRADVVKFRLRKGSLLGFEVVGPGRLIDPVAKGFTNTERYLRSQFQIALARPIWLYDTTDEPSSRWPHLVICILMLLTAGLALFGLSRFAREKLDARS